MSNHLVCDVRLLGVSAAIAAAGWILGRLMHVSGMPNRRRWLGSRRAALAVRARAIVQAAVAAGSVRA